MQFPESGVEKCFCFCLCSFDTSIKYNFKEFSWSFQETFVRKSFFSKIAIKIKFVLMLLKLLANDSAEAFSTFFYSIEAFDLKQFKTKVYKWDFWRNLLKASDLEINCKFSRVQKLFSKIVHWQTFFHKQISTRRNYDSLQRKASFF